VCSSDLGHEFDLQAMFDRLDHPARGRRGGGEGAPTTIARGDGTALRGKGKQFIPEGARVQMAFPGGAGYGPTNERPHTEILRDLALGYISAEAARETYGLSTAEIGETLARAAKGEMF
jgi:N-methylhydantoinase B